MICLAFETSNFAAAIPLVKTLRQKFPTHKIILRPHPTEKIEPYEAQLKGIEGVAVLREGPAAAWILACDVLVHTSCTTANEAFALGVPAVCYETLPSPLHNYFLSGKLSLIARTETEVVAIVSDILAGKKRDVRAQTATFNNFFAAQSGAFAAQRIVDSMLPEKQPSAEMSTWKAGVLFRRRWWPTAFQRRMFPDFSEQQLADRLTQLVKQTGLKHVPKVYRLGDGLYHLRPAAMALSAETKRRFLPI